MSHVDAAGAALYTGAGTTKDLVHLETLRRSELFPTAFTYFFILENLKILEPKTKYTVDNFYKSKFNKV